MSTNNRISPFSKLITNKLTDFGSVDNAFFITPFQHVLAGFFFEKTRAGVYIWDFAFPLFERFDGLNLLYSQRVPNPNGYIETSGMSKQEIADGFVERISPRLTLAKEALSVAGFCDLVSAREALLKHEHAKMVLSFGKVLLGLQAEAISLLQSAIPDLSESYASDCQVVLRLLLVGDASSARLAVQGFEEDTKRRLGLN